MSEVRNSSADIVLCHVSRGFAVGFIAHSRADPLDLSSLIFLESRLRIHNGHHMAKCDDSVNVSCEDQASAWRGERYQALLNSRNHVVGSR